MTKGRVKIGFSCRTMFLLWLVLFSAPGPVLAGDARTLNSTRLFLDARMGSDLRTPAPLAGIGAGVQFPGGLRWGAGVASLEIENVLSGNDMLSSDHTLRYYAWIGLRQGLSRSWIADWSLRGEYANLDDLTRSTEVRHEGRSLALIGSVNLSRTLGPGSIGFGIGVGFRDQKLDQHVAMSWLGFPFTENSDSYRFVAEATLGVELGIDLR